MSDIVERLRRAADFDEVASLIPTHVLALAADEIERLRTALQAFADHFGPLEDNHMLSDEARKCFRLAREALAQPT